MIDTKWRSKMVPKLLGLLDFASVFGQEQLKGTLQWRTYLLVLRTRVQRVHKQILPFMNENKFIPDNKIYN